MATKTTKKLNAQTTTTTVASGEKFAKVDANGIVTLIDTGNLRNAILGGMTLDCMLDGVAIMYHRKVDGFPLLARPDKWPALQNSGEVADGVAIIDGGRVLVVAPTEADSAGILWSSAPMSGDWTTTGDRLEAMDDWNGKSNTAAIIAKSSSAAVTNTAAYAPGFCNLYSRANTNGEGLTAGKWWLPSIGETLAIFANFKKVNYCLGLINGATPLSEDRYWSSTDVNSTFVWYMNFSYCAITTWTKKAVDKCKVRPVSAFIV